MVWYEWMIGQVWTEGSLEWNISSKARKEKNKNKKEQISSQDKMQQKLQKEKMNMHS